jgi:hypothetical protein
MIHSRTCFHLSSTKSKPIHILWVPHMKVVKLQVHFIFYKHLWQNIFIQWTTTPKIEPSRFKFIYSKKLASLGLKKWMAWVSSVVILATMSKTFELEPYKVITMSRLLKCGFNINFSMLWAFKASYLSLQLIIKTPFYQHMKLTLNRTLCMNTLIKNATFKALESNMQPLIWLMIHCFTIECIVATMALQIACICLHLVHFLIILGFFAFHKKRL